jgi:hypothetical protein
MTRLRRVAMERKHQPRLDSRIWRWLEAGRPDEQTLPIEARIEVFLLEGAPSTSGSVHRIRDIVPTGPVCSGTESWRRFG